MSKEIDRIDAALAEWLEAQPVFFVGTAPVALDGHVNVSPKGLDTLRVLGEREVAYQDLTGSGAETSRICTRTAASCSCSARRVE